MSRKQYSKELKLELVKKHLEDGISYWKLGKEYGIEASIIRRWGHKYETFGEDDKKGKLYLSVILDLCDRRPVAFVYSIRNDTKYVSRGKMYR